MSDFEEITLDDLYNWTRRQGVCNFILDAKNERLVCLMPGAKMEKCMPHGIVLELGRFSPGVHDGEQFAGLSGFTGDSGFSFPLTSWEDLDREIRKAAKEYGIETNQMPLF